MFFSYLYKMINGERFTEMALSFAGTEQRPHMERTGFRVVGKRMFATYLAKNNTANIFLTAREQALFCGMDPANIHPVPNKWGEKGATTFHLDRVAREAVMEALLSAYSEVMGRRNKTRRPEGKSNVGFLILFLIFGLWHAQLAFYEPLL